MKFDYTGRVALITGAGGGIGRTIAIRMQKMGYTLALLGRNEEKLRQTAEIAGPPGQDLPGVRLMADVPHDAIVGM